ncbi:hypothetical protein BB559_004949 [Furculomyces boomerangus]|uniref:Golgi apparatus membrane protein TVP23 n=1 Tax=Furculomyces boomerangus TaxID=61424 RepID=A0A2T9Y5W4_9FUNG|nr:hypothetical protein BB559_005915 [Furculomyces boomerangus]PVU89781.1 hypothetical protein BB559_004949 [Furculomyces boomerangus]
MAQNNVIPDMINNDPIYGQNNMAVSVQPDNPQQNMFNKSSHPIALLFYILFKGLALTSYLLGNIFTSNFVLIFVSCILNLSLDFWTVKNVSGRLLVGMRWWSQVNDVGKSEWIFEHREVTNSSDSSIFWIMLYITPLVWGVLAFVAILSFSFQWLLIVFIAIILSSTNLVGYTKCEKDAKNKWTNNNVTSQASQFVNNFMSNMVTNSITGRIFGRT